MKKEIGIKTRDLLILLGVLVAILIAISTQWATAGDMFLSTILK